MQSTNSEYGSSYLVVCHFTKAECWSLLAVLLPVLWRQSRGLRRRGTEPWAVTAGVVYSDLQHAAAAPAAVGPSSLVSALTSHQCPGPQQEAALTDSSPPAPCSPARDARLYEYKEKQWFYLYSICLMHNWWNKSLMLTKAVHLIKNTKIQNNTVLFEYILKCNLFLWSKAEFELLLQTSVSRDPSEISPICWFQ